MASVLKCHLTSHLFIALLGTMVVLSFVSIPCSFAELVNCTNLTCVDVGQPVCAKFGDLYQIFDNLCYVLKEKCEKNTEWEVVDMNICSTLNCRPICTKELFFTCATDGTTIEKFANPCMFRYYQCSHPNESWERLLDCD